MSDILEERIEALRSRRAVKLKFEAKPKLVRPGAPVTLSWNAQRADQEFYQVTIKDSARETIFGGPARGSHTVFPQQTTWYVLSLEGEGVHEQVTAKVEVRPGGRRP